MKQQKNVNPPTPQLEILAVEEIIGKRFDTITHGANSKSIKKVDEVVLDQGPSRK